MRTARVILFLMAMAVPCAGFAQEFDYHSIEDAQKVAKHLNSDYRVRFDGGPLKDGTAVYNADRDLAFWVSGETLYAVNDRARAAAPDLPQVPVDVTYEAVYEASCTMPLTREMRPSEIAMKGREMSAEEARAMEETVQAHPADVWARTMLIGYYGESQFRSPDSRKQVEHQVLWLIKNVPEADVVGSNEARLEAHLNPDAYAEAAQLLKERVEKDPRNLRLLANAAEFFMIGEKDYAAECLKKCSEIEPNNPLWHEKLGFIHSMASRTVGFMGMPAVPDSGAATEALAEQERALALTADPDKKTTLRVTMAETAFAAGDTGKARSYATEILESANKEANWDYGNAVHTGNCILGRIALKEGDTAKAKDFLLAAGKCGGSPQLNSFGPDMTLANELLQKGERDTVIQYLELCGAFWKKEITDKWIKEIQSGQTPNLNSMSAVMAGTGLPMPDFPGFSGSRRMPDNWNTPLLTLTMPTERLETFDALYGVPLLLLLAMVLWVRLFSNWQHLWILAPLAVVYVLPITVAHFIPSLFEMLFGLKGGSVQHLVSTYFGGLALLWLLSDLLARAKTWALAPAAVVIMGLAGLLGTVNYGYRFHVLAEIVTFIAVVTASFTLARVCCPGSYSAKRFMTFLFVFNVALMLVIWPPLWIAMQVALFHFPLFELIVRLPQHLLISLVNGVGLFALMVPFLLLASYVPLYREQFRKVLQME